jgi:ABC-type Na+ transport system ATPase subunit NatA
MTCDSVIIIHQGRVAAQGTLEGVRNEYRGKTLEDVFVQITGAVD